MAIIATMAGVIGYLLRGRGTESYGLQAAQNTVASLLTLVRSQAAVDGRNAALFVHVDAANPTRYLRFLVPARRNETDTDWEPLSEGVYLPQGCYVVGSNTPSGAAVEAGASWGTMRSGALQVDVSLDLDFGAGESYKGTVITPRGTTGNTGRIVLATGRVPGPGASPPFVFTNPDNVRAVQIYTYGQVVRLNNRKDVEP